MRWNRARSVAGCGHVRVPGGCWRGSACERRDEVGGRLDHQLPIQRVGQYVGELGLAGGRRAVEAQPAVPVAPQRLGQALGGDAAGEVEEGRVEGRGGRALARGATAMQQTPGGRQAAADRIERVAARLQVEQAAGGTELGRGQL